MHAVDSARRLLSATDLVAGLALPEVESRLQAGLRLNDAGHRILAFYLADMQGRGLHSAVGYSSTAFYAEARLGLDRRRATELIRAGKRLLALPRIDRAFCEQLIGWTKVRELVKVVVPQHEEAWLERARNTTARELKREIARVQEGEAPRQPGDRRGLSAVRFSIRAKVPALTHRKWDLARQKLSDEAGQPLGDTDVMDLLADLCLGTEADGTLPGRTRVHSSIYRVLLYDRGDGEPPEVDSELGRIPVESCSCKPCRDEHDIDATTPLTMRIEVLGRDGNACRCCGSHYRLHVHHVAYRSHGGRTHPSNLITLCMRCHALVHEDLLMLVGPAARQVRFQDAEGRDLDTPEGYVPAAVLIRMTPPELPETAPAPATAPAPSTARAPDVARIPAPDAHPEPVPLAKAFEGIVGQDTRLQTFETAAKGSRARGRCFPHTLLVGPPGTGKTSLAEGIARLAGARLIRTCGPVFQDPAALVQLLGGLHAGDALFLDEAHALPRPVQEVLYEAMEKGRFIDRELPLFTVLAATTEDGDLPAPFRNRFGLVEHLGFYEDGDLADLALSHAHAEDVTLTQGAATHVAAFAHGTPREALRLLDRVLDEAAAQGLDGVDANVAQRVFGRMGYDAHGHDPAQQAYLRLLGASTRPLSLHRIATTLGLSVRTVLERVEPPLFREGRVQVTRRGRVAACGSRGSPLTGASMIRDRAPPRRGDYALRASMRSTGTSALSLRSSGSVTSGSRSRRQR